MILRAIAGGGDTDTLAAMASALAGARRGMEGIPDAWQAVEGSDRFIQLADQIREVR